MKRVLIVDDSTFMRQQIRSIMKKTGYEVVGEAEDGALAVEKFKELLPDIVTLDITMPVMDGIEVLRRIKALGTQAKVIMVTAMGQDIIVHEAITIGASGFLVKPFKPDAIVGALKRAYEF